MGCVSDGRSFDGWQRTDRLGSQLFVGEVALGEDGVDADLVVDELEGRVDGVAAEGDGKVEEEPFGVVEGGREAQGEEAEGGAGQLFEGGAVGQGVEDVVPKNPDEVGSVEVGSFGGDALGLLLRAEAFELEDPFEPVARLEGAFGGEGVGELVEGDEDFGGVAGEEAGVVAAGGLEFGVEVGEDEGVGGNLDGLGSVSFGGSAEDTRDFGEEALDGGDGAEFEFGFGGGDEVAEVVGAQGEVRGEAGVAGVNVAAEEKEDGVPEVGEEAAGDEFGGPVAGGFQGGVGEGREEGAADGDALVAGEGGGFEGGSWVGVHFCLKRLIEKSRERKRGCIQGSRRFEN